jgi:AcrR family transcriptional regulator
MSEPTVVERPLRSDAAANRQRIIAAAADEFAEHGQDACIEDIARRAGVGVGTIYRRFPTKAALAEALAEELVAHVHGLATSALAEQERGAAFEAYVMGLCGLRSRYGRALVWLYGLEPAAERLRNEVKPLMRRMIKEGKEAGRLRQDLSENDLGLLMWSLQGVLDATRQIAPEAWRRLVETVFAGWRVVDGPSLPTRPMTTAQVDQVTAVLRRR